MFSKFSKLLSTILILLSLTACFIAETKTIYDYRNKYIGDNSKTINVVSQLNFDESLNYDHMAIEYAGDLNILELYFTSDTSQINADLELNLFKNSSILYALIENLDQVDIYINSEVCYSTSKEEVENSGIFLKNFNEYFNSEEYFYEFENELKEIDREDLNKL
ncbi:putative secreted protein [Peptoniphilus sp. ING2-D1G]|nr:putative secreted protein [Peptoniphilus sp. ING2-D1G]